jgi:Fe-S cluster assembly ATP-binding protein
MSGGYIVKEGGADLVNQINEGGFESLCKNCNENCPARGN